MNRLSKVLTVVALSGVAVMPPMAVALKPGGSLAGTEVGHVLALFLRLDQSQVKAGPGLSMEQVDVYWSGWVEGPGETRVRILHNGKPDQSFPREYGENDFSVFYSGKPVLERQRQFKTAWWHYHTYTINVSRLKEGQLSAYLASTGPDQI